MMRWKKRWSQFFTTVCTSFTLVVLLYVALADWMEADVTVRSIWDLFAICAAVGVVIFLTDLLPVRSVPLRLVIAFFDVCATVFLVGGAVLKFIPLDAAIILTVLGMICAAYAAVFAVSIVNERIAAADINHKVMEMKKHRQREVSVNGKSGKSEYTEHD